jgi:hypothetical protein
MICAFCDRLIESEPEWVLVDRMNIQREFCCLGCMSGYVDELVIEAEEKSNGGLVN